MDDIHQIFRDRRRMLGITQQELADIAGTGIRAVLSVENPSGNPTLKTLQQVAWALGMEITAIIKHTVK